ncbi:FAD-dependent oxidoreductase [Castellaniella sp.]|uniref:FAD-dependent oxidoreductase n=1 Tax=Castellaniella sp. TaxID=1955812 RepID=UPI002AFFB302|nr:FAD-dependent oxidoreductase [Castellaniella sp.]
MINTYQHEKQAYIPAPELQSNTLIRHPVVIVGAGPVGLATAIDLAQQGVPVVLLDEGDTLAVGSRGICLATRTLEILDRLGVGDECVAKGVGWDVGRTFFRDKEIYRFNLQPQPDHHRAGVINLQQYYLEDFLRQRAKSLPLLDLRHQNRVVGVHASADTVTLQVDTPDGSYAMAADWLVACDGPRSTVRRSLGLEAEGTPFMDRFLVADITIQTDFPAERWFWFDPPFHPGQSVLLHHQSDNTWRIDFQLGWNADPETEKQANRVIPRIRSLLGEEHEFELGWVEVYTFQCRRMPRLRHGRVLFAGDAAHQVSPFGARGSNAGIQDADNLGWKLRMVVQGLAPEQLLDSYSDERILAADENLQNSARSMDFITPKTKTTLAFRNAVLGLAQHYPFARALVNSGRLSVPTVLKESTLNTPDTTQYTGDMIPGAPCDDCPMRAQVDHFWLLSRLGNDFKLLVYAEDPAKVEQASALQGLLGGKLSVDVMLVTPKGGRSPHGLQVIEDYTGRFAERYDARPGTVWLIRPDQHIAARWDQLDVAQVRQAISQATAQA